MTATQKERLSRIGRGLDRTRGVWGRATVIDSKDSGKPQKAALNGAYNRFFDPEIGLMEPEPSGQDWT